ncbi:amino acid adenylation domain-containing protein [Pseudoalteromonas sp. DY56-GL79]|uniref:non-ribosomal peptide synthetase n=1 Tax=Pseudoalteromonas sp. DY56-GL79 TaxID=2967131 RepID=UPI003529DC19
MSVVELLREVKNKGIILYLENGSLAFKAPPGAMDNEIKAQIIAKKSEIVSLLQQQENTGIPTIISRPKRDDKLQPASFAQQRLWFIDSMQKGSAEYNMPVAFEVSGTLDLATLTKVFAAIIERHEILRTVYLSDAGEVQQVIRDMTEIDFSITVENLEHLTGEMLESEVQTLISCDMNTPFNLAQDLMLRVSYIHKAEGSGVLLFNMHHIASDGWSTEILIKEFITLYQAFSEGEQNPLPELPVQYADYSHWQREYVAGEVLDGQLRYWESQLKDVPMIHSLPCDFSRQKSKQTMGKLVHGQLSGKLAKTLLDTAKKLQLTPFMLVHAGFSLLLARHSNSNDIVIGTPIANRTQAELESLIGLFTNTLVLRANTEHKSLHEYFDHIRQVHLGAQSNQDVPFEQLVERLNVPRSSEYSPLFQVMLTTSSDFGVNENSNSQTLALPNAELKAYLSDQVQAKFDIELNVSISELGASLDWTFDDGLFETQHIEQLNQHLCSLFEAIGSVNDPKQVAPSSLPMMSEIEINRLVHELNGVEQSYDNEKCIHELFEQQVASSPKQTAVVFADKALTFAELNQKANQVAHCLRAKHEITPDTLIGLCVERSLEMVVCILGILKAGAAYVPLDPSHPNNRLMDIISETEPKVVLTQSELLNKFELSESKVLIVDDLIDGDNSPFIEYPTDNLDKSTIGLTTNHLAYVMYTSGTTGKPKGIMVQHCGLLARKAGWDHIFEIDKTPLTVLQMAGLSVDILLGDIIKALCSNAGKLIVCPYETLISAHELCNLINIHQVTYGDFVPSVVRELGHYLVNNEQKLHGLKFISIGCEAWKVDDLELLNQVVDNSTRIFNLYGQTETVIDASYFDTSKYGIEYLRSGSIPLGTPFPNTALYVLDDNRQLVPNGVTGTLYVAGHGLAKGYFGNSELTAEKFVRNESSDIKEQRLYCTGDLVRRLSDGSLEFVGRVDEQVKIRGFRIELSEIEAQISALSDVDSAVVMAKEVQGSLQIVAYVKPLDLAMVTNTEESSESQFKAALRSVLKEKLPEYMIPTIVMIIESWPLNANGKVDKKALPEPDRASIGQEYVAPKTEVEEHLAKVWSELLNLEVQQISTTANFFELGGHSLLISRLVAALNEQYEISLALKEVFELPTIKGIAALVEASKAAAVKQVETTVSEKKNSIVI